MGELTPRKMRRLMEDWKSRPLDRRAFLAVRTAYIANLFVRESPNDPLSAEIREKLPRALRDDSDTALNGDPKKPAVAFEFATAYLQLTFAPKDPEMERRVAELGTHLKRGRRGQAGE
jgi:hypothetical protein